MKILFAASEAMPFVKTGGLADVAYALPHELAKQKDVEVSVFLPYYKSIKENAALNIEFVTSFGVPLAWRMAHCGIFKTTLDQGRLTYYFIDNEYYFNRDGLYGHLDDGERYAYFSKAILESLQHLGYTPDVIHCNDWQTGFLPLLLKASYSHLEAYRKIRTVFTIHNIEYQGKAGYAFLGDVLGVSDDWHNVATQGDCLNAMKAAIVLCDKLTTVSRTYSHEIRHAYYAHGLEKILLDNAYKIEGIVNGIDTEQYNPQKDKYLFQKFHAGDLAKKTKNKTWLQNKLGLRVDPNVPMVAMISRLVAHKGLELIEHVASQLLALDMQLVVLGTGDKQYEDLFHTMAYTHPDKVSANITFNAELAHQIYAGADLFLMPSKSEPCGLSQLISMRYGTIPIVRETGGLFDTVPAINTETGEGRGFTFKVFNAHDMLNAVERGICYYHDKDKLRQTVTSIMNYDSSWKEPVQQYIRIYHEVKSYA